MTDKELSTALRAAAKLIDEQRKQIASLTATTMPIDDSLTVFDFVPLIRKSKSNTQIKLIVDLIDALYATDCAIMEDNDWTLLVAVISKCKRSKNFEAVRQQLVDLHPGGGRHQVLVALYSDGSDSADEEDRPACGKPLTGAAWEDGLGEACDGIFENADSQFVDRQRSLR